MWDWLGDHITWLIASGVAVTAWAVATHYKVQHQLKDHEQRLDRHSKRMAELETKILAAIERFPDARYFARLDEHMRAGHQHTSQITTLHFRMETMERRHETLELKVEANQRELMAILSKLMERGT